MWIWFKYKDTLIAEVAKSVGLHFGKLSFGWEYQLCIKLVFVKTRNWRTVARVKKYSSLEKFTCDQTLQQNWLSNFNQNASKSYNTNVQSIVRIMTDFHSGLLRSLSCEMRQFHSRVCGGRSSLNEALMSLLTNIFVNNSSMSHVSRWSPIFCLLFNPIIRQITELIRAEASIFAIEFSYFRVWQSRNWLSHSPDMILWSISRLWYDLQMVLPTVGFILKFGSELGWATSPSGWLRLVQVALRPGFRLRFLSGARVERL